MLLLFIFNALFPLASLREIQAFPHARSRALAQERQAR